MTEPEQRYSGRWSGQRVRDTGDRGVHTEAFSGHGGGGGSNGDALQPVTDRGEDKQAHQAFDVWAR